MRRRSGSSRVGWVVGIAAVIALAACQPAAPTPAPTLPPTAVPSVTPAPTATPGLDAVSLRVQIGEPGAEAPVRLPADTRAQVPVTVYAEAPDGIDLEGLEVGLQIFGSGSFAQSRIPLQNGQATTLYTAGEAAEAVDVELRTVLDVPRLGRVTESATLRLIRQALDLAVTPRQLILVDGQGEAALQLAADPADLDGHYRVVLASADPAVALNLDGVPYTHPVLLSPGRYALGLTYTGDVPPGESAVGETTICADLPERPSQPSSCALLTWGSAGDTLVVQSAPVVDQTRDIVELRLALQRNGFNVATRASLCYDVLIPPEPPTDDPFLREWQTDLPFLPGECQSIALSNGGVVYVGYRAAHGAWMLRWSVFAPGLVNPITWDVLIARQIAGLAPNAPPEVPLGNGAVIALPPENGEVDISLYADQLLNSAPVIPVLVAVYVPEQTPAIDPVTGSASLPVRFALDQPTEAVLRWTGERPVPIYTAPETTFLDTAAWHRIIFRTNLAAELLKMRIIEGDGS